MTSLHGEVVAGVPAGVSGIAQADVDIADMQGRCLSGAHVEYFSCVISCRMLISLSKRTLAGSCILFAIW